MSSCVAAVMLLGSPLALYNNMHNKTHYPYTALFCEENIWQLVKELSTKDRPHDTSYKKRSYEEAWVLFITNPTQNVPLLNQKAVPAGETVFWDYHVILLIKISQRFVVFDFDTRLPFVTPLEHYIKNTFISLTSLPEILVPYIRKIPAQSYLEKFHSDRSHMLKQIETSAFPPWPVINAEQENVITLEQYLNLNQFIVGTEIIKFSTHEEFLSRFDSN